MSLYNNCLGSTSGCAVELVLQLQPELIPDPTTDLSGGKPDANLLDLGSVT